MMGLFRSRKFQAALVGVIVVILKQLVPDLAEVDVYAVVLPIVAYILGQAAEDFALKQ